MFFTIISILLVILFVILLHLYARWFFSQVHLRSQTSFSRPYILGSRVHHRVTRTSTSTRRGLPSSVISSLPLFIYKISPPFDSSCITECAICLSVFQEEEIGRKLPVCGHAFHVDCIDMWLHSHSTCPICRSTIFNHNRIIDYIEIDLVDQEGELLQLEIGNALSSPETESPETRNMVLDLDSGTSGSSSSGSFTGLHSFPSEAKEKDDL
ncbi:RING-H2 finger protein ATL63-like protein [Tanacetum coccineum]